MNGVGTQKKFSNKFINRVAIMITMLLGVLCILNASDAIIFIIGVAFILVLLLLPPMDSVNYLMFILCANEMINFGSTSLTMIFVAFFFIYNCSISIKKIKMTAGIIFSTSLLLLVCVISYLLTGAKDAFVSTIKHVFFLYYTSVVLTESYGEWKILYTNAFRYMSAGILFFGLISILVNGLPSLTERFTFSNEVTINFVAISCAIAVINLLYADFFIHSKEKEDIFLVLGCIVIGILTQSRTFIFAVGLGVMFLVLFTPSLTRRMKYIFALLVCMAIFALIIISVPAIAERIGVVLERITTPSEDDISNGRYDLWSLTINSMTENGVFFWLGAGDYNSIGASFDDKVMVAHNLFLETWVIYGLIGCLILIMLYVFFIKRYIFVTSKLKIKLVSLVPIIVMLCCLFYSHHFIGRSMSIVFAFSFLPMVINVPKGDNMI